MTDKPKRALDEIFDKNVMERAFRYVCVFDGEQESIDLSEYSGADAELSNAVHECYLHTAEFIPEPLDCVVIAYEREGKDIYEIARRRIRLSLNIELLDDQPAQGEG